MEKPLTRPKVQRSRSSARSREESSLTHRSNTFLHITHTPVKMKFALALLALIAPAAAFVSKSGKASNLTFLLSVTRAPPGEAPSQDVWLRRLADCPSHERINDEAAVLIH